MTTEQGNKLIRVWMNHDHEVIHRAYDKDWNELMSAWAKFRELDLPGKEYRDYFNDIGYAILKCLIEKAFIKLAEAIRWYNEQNPHQPNK